MAMILAVSVPFAASVILVTAGLISLVSVSWALRALGVMLVVRVANPAFLGDLTGPVTLLGWVVLALAGTRIYLTAMSSAALRSGPAVGLLVFLLAVVLLSIAASDYIAVSLFKISSFAFGAGAVLLGQRHLAARHIGLFPDVLALWIGVLVASLPLAALPEAGYFLDGEGFQGVTNHPQMLAAFCAPILVWAAFQVLIGAERAGLIAWALLGLSLVEAFLSRGRTSVAAAGLAGIFCILCAIFGHRAWRRELFSAKALPRVVALITIVVGCTALYQVQVRDAITSFVFKRDVATLSDSIETSRGYLIVEEIANFLGNPWTGIGFGVSRSAIHEFEPVIEPVTGLAIGASTEKANIVVALLEEVGILGTAAFLPFILAVMALVMRRPPLALGGAALAALAINVSEMVFFSMGGLGLYVLILIGVAAYHPRLRSSQDAGRAE